MRESRPVLKRWCFALCRTQLPDEEKKLWTPCQFAVKVIATIARPIASRCSVSVDCRWWLAQAGLTYAPRMPVAADTELAKGARRCSCVSLSFHALLLRLSRCHVIKCSCVFALCVLLADLVNMYEKTILTWDPSAKVGACAPTLRTCTLRSHRLPVHCAGCGRSRSAFRSWHRARGRRVRCALTALRLRCSTHD